MERVPEKDEHLPPLVLLRRPVPDWCTALLSNRVSGGVGDTVLESRLLTRAGVAKAKAGK